MAVGYCSECGQLVEITAGGRHGGYLDGTTSRRWYPKPHLDADGKRCTTSREAGDIRFGNGSSN